MVTVRGQSIPDAHREQIEVIPVYRKETGQLASDPHRVTGSSLADWERVQIECAVDKNAGRTKL